MSQIKMWYKINVEQVVIIILIYCLAWNSLFLYFDLIAKSELICLVYWKQKD